MIFTSASSIVLTFPLEKLQLIRDQSTGMYRTWTYATGKFIADLPISTLLPALFCCIFYFFVGLANTAGQFFYFFLICWLTVGVGNGLGMFLGSAFSDAELAASIMPLVIVPLMLFGGLFISTLEDAWRWNKAGARAGLPLPLPLASAPSPLPLARSAPRPLPCPCPWLAPPRFT